MASNTAGLGTTMAGFNIYDLEGRWKSFSESDDPLAAACSFFRPNDVLWAISMAENDDGSITASFGEQTIILKPAPQD
jgi:hypothetical protein